MTSPPLSRRHALTLLAVTASGTLLPRSLRAQSQDLLADSDVCMVLPEVTEGPYYLNTDLLRRDIRDGKPGVPLLLRLQVVDSACVPLATARVDVWHCDAQGIYSSFGGGDNGQTSTEGETFLRGTQRTDERGIVEFDTIYPGWYRGRTTHIHYKIYLDTRNVLTGQIFFPDALSEYLYLNSPAYQRDRERDTLNATDDIAQQATRAAYAAITEGETAYLAQMIIGVDPGATSQAGQAPGGVPGGDGTTPPPPPGTPLNGSPPSEDRDPSARLIPGSD
ncbi:MAG: intradiol ring-cleavage dioxygenase [Rhodobacteraceae bacterium]|nr:intradiol ring-cleavage dioxygenase [Paracoccaceae bacterium]